MENGKILPNPDLTTRTEQNDNISINPRLSKLMKFRRILIVFILPLIMGFTFGKCELFGVFAFAKCDFNPQISYNDYSGAFCVTSDGKVYELTTCSFFDLKFQVPGEPALNSIISLLGLIVAVGENGTIITGVVGPGQNEWIVVKSPTANTLTDLCHQNTEFYAVGELGTVLKSTDFGDSWFSLPSPTLFHLYKVDCPEDDVVQVYGAGYVGYKSTDGGNTWSAFNFPMFESSAYAEQADGPIDITASFFLNESTGYVFGDFGLSFFTNDGGTSWVPRHAFEFEQISTAYFTSVDSGMIAGDNGKIRFTTDGGLSWLEDSSASSITTQNIRHIEVRADSVAVVVGDSGLVVFAATDPSLIIPVELISFTASVRSNTVTLNWTTATELNNSCFEIQRSPCSQDSWTKLGFIEGNGTTTETHNYSYVDADIPAGQYMYRLKQIDFDGQYEYSDIVEVEIIPLEYALFQNYPNPFNPETVIRFNISSSTSEFVSLIVYDLLGNDIKRLAYEERNQGSYRVVWDGTNESGVRVGSGVYLYGLETNSFRQYNKMVMLK